MTFQILLLLGLLLLSAFFSGAETALFSLSRHELQRFRQDKRPSRRLVADLMRRPRRLLLTLMIGNVSINMFIFAASLSLSESVLGPGSALAPIVGLASPVLVTLLGDILPKGVAILLRVPLAVRLAPAVRFAQIVLTPFRIVLSGVLVEPLTRLLVGARKPDEYVTVEELRELVEMSERHRVIDAHENAMLDQVVQLGELRAKDIMIPRVDMIAYDVYDNPHDLERLMREHEFTKIPVYDTEIDRIAGIIYAKDLLLHPGRPLAQLARPAHYVPELITIAQLIEELRRRKTQLAIVVDEFGGVVGLVTVDDVAELIVGGLGTEDESDQERLWVRLDERRYRVSGGMSIHDWSDQFEMSRMDEEVATLAGLILARLGRVPAVGDKLRMGNLILTIESLRGRRIEWVLLELADDASGVGGTGKKPGGAAP
ncbi:MAG: HlyC/CorC family transporter [Planctomycetes bacterium]|nr:HlyC/CorC family transporter [Planctomycetota bacterium]